MEAVRDIREVITLICNEYIARGFTVVRYESIHKLLENKEHKEYVFFSTFDCRSNWKSNTHLDNFIHTPVDLCVIQQNVKYFPELCDKETFRKKTKLKPIILQKILVVRTKENGFIDIMTKYNETKFQEYHQLRKQMIQQLKQNHLDASNSELGVLCLIKKGFSSRNHLCSLKSHVLESNKKFALSGSEVVGRFFVKGYKKFTSNYPLEEKLYNSFRSSVLNTLHKGCCTVDSLKQSCENDKNNFIIHYPGLDRQQLHCDDKLSYTNMYTEKKKIDSYCFFCNIDVGTNQYIYVVPNLESENEGVEAKLEYGDALVLPGNVFHSGMEYRNRERVQSSLFRNQNTEEIVKSCFCLNDEMQYWHHS
jgi:hypothetical protein